MYACMYVCMYGMYYTYMYICTHVYTHTHIHAHVHAYIHTYTHTCMHAYSPNTKNISSRQKVCKLLLLSLTLLQPGCRCTSSESASIMLFQTFMRACILLRWICVNDIVSNWRTCGCVCVCVCIHVSGPASIKVVRIGRDVDVCVCTCTVGHKIYTNILLQPELQLRTK
jgi:hypothetical protein